MKDGVKGAVGKVALAALFFFVLQRPGDSRAEDELPLHGFLQGNYSANSRSSNPDGGDFKRAEERLELRLDAAREPLRLFLKGDASYDHIDAKAKVELREGYVDYVATKWDLRLGRQIVTWGIGDLAFVNDVFPKDYEAFFSGRPVEYMKKGVDGAKFSAYPDLASFELVVIPFFEPDTFPRDARFWIFDPMPGVKNRETKEPPATLKNTEEALRIYRELRGFEAAVYLYRGFFRSPSMAPDNPSAPSRLSLFYPGLNVYGASLQGRALDGVLSLEAGYYDSRQDRTGTDPYIPNSSTRLLAGFQRQAWEDFTIGLQYYYERMSDYSGYLRNSPQGLPKARENRDLASIRLTQLLKHQTLKLSAYGAYGPADKDYLVMPEINYKFSDNVWASLGANVFGGKHGTQFGSLDRDDNIYIQIRREF